MDAARRANGGDSQFVLTIVGDNAVAELIRHDPDLENADIGAELPWSIARSKTKEFFSEFLSTFILLCFGEGTVAQNVLSGSGDTINIGFGWGIGVMMGIYVGGKSGAHMNPAVTLACCIFRGFKWKKLPIYVLAQVLGAMSATAVVYLNYKTAIDIHEGGPDIRTIPGISKTGTAGIYSTYAQPFLSSGQQFFSEFLATALLIFCLFALLDHRNLGINRQLLPLGMFFVIFGIAVAFGWETGFAINPARDFGPRAVASMLGYSVDIWTVHHNYAWVPIIAPLIGGSFGALMYDIFIYTGESPINTPWFGLRKPKQTGWSSSQV
ncbi:aquaporin [Microthyrium microscopicum]|uniref:Aquaporin n=1 Tax=Microthyrium microscopicum TaxID=703497 RepID=A0A6A6UEV1_9PEZI|nr:aquaporin [Microthyrium microscopicum]